MHTDAERRCRSFLWRSTSATGVSPKGRRRRAMPHVFDWAGIGVMGLTASGGHVRVVVPCGGRWWGRWRHVADRRRCEQTPMVINGTFGSAERCSDGHLACVAAAVSCGMTGGRVCYARVGTAGTPDGDGWVIDAHAPSLGLGGRVLV